MLTSLRRALRRRLSAPCALAALLGAASCALAQSPISTPAPTKEPEPRLAATPVLEPRLAPLPLAPSVAQETHLPVARRFSVPWLFTPLRHRPEPTPPSNDTPAPTPEELARVQSGQASLVESAAVKIKADEAGAPARRAAIRYLASVRCHYFPEAEAALIAALRADRNEMVRIEAANALAGGCCCTPKTLEALVLAANGSERDGNPAETSDRVKAIASVALHYFSSRGYSVPPPDTLPPATRKTNKDLELTSFTTSPTPAKWNNSGVTPAELRFAQTAGTQSSEPERPRFLPSTLASTAISLPPPQNAPAVPAVRLAPIGVIPTSER